VVVRIWAISRFSPDDITDKRGLEWDREELHVEALRDFISGSPQGLLLVERFGG
jgi:hypothetical protein